MVYYKNRGRLLYIWLAYKQHTASALKKHFARDAHVQPMAHYR